MRALIVAGTLALLVLLARPQAAVAAGSGCSIDTTPKFAFTSSYDVFSPAPVSLSSDLTFTCKQSYSYVVSINAGLHGANVAQRAMAATGGSDSLTYNLYVDATDITVFGDGTNGSQTVSGFASANTKVTVPIYGRLPAQQNVAAGAYGDTLTLTISY